MPDWLPNIADVSTYPSCLSAMYGVFTADIKQRGIFYEGRRVIYDGRPGPQGLEEGFWHLFEKENQKTRQREFDPRRAERLPWLKPVVDNQLSDAVTTWKAIDDKGRTQAFFWLEEQDYIVILTERKGRWYLTTAYYVGGEGTRRKFRKSYENRLQE